MIIRLRPHHFERIKQLSSGNRLVRTTLLLVARYVYGKTFYDSILNLEKNRDNNLLLQVTRDKEEDHLCQSCPYYSKCNKKQMLKLPLHVKLFGKLSYYAAISSDRRAFFSLNLSHDRIYRYDDLFEKTNNSSIRLQSAFVLFSQIFVAPYEIIKEAIRIDRAFIKSKGKDFESLDPKIKEIISRIKKYYKILKFGE